MVVFFCHRTFDGVVDVEVEAINQNSYLFSLDWKIKCESTAKREGKPSVEGLASPHQDHVMIPTSFLPPSLSRHFPHWFSQ